MTKAVLFAAFLAAFGAVGNSTYAQDAPTTGMVHNKTEANSLTYYCTKLTTDLLECKFTQSSVRKKANPGDLARKIDSAVAEFRAKPPRFEPSECVDKDRAIDLIEGRRQPRSDQERSGLAAMPENQKQHFARFMRAFLQHCKNPTEQTLIELVRLGFAWDARVCLVSSHAFDQRFRRAVGTQNWIVEDKPSGPCGIIQLGRFEPEKSSGLTFWKYYSRKAITNPNAGFLGLSCAKLDQAEYEYDWRSKDWNMGCDVVEFSPL